jgi:hypothetical protein
MLQNNGLEERIKTQERMKNQDTRKVQGTSNSIRGRKESRMKGQGTRKNQEQKFKTQVIPCFLYPEPLNLPCALSLLS